MIKSLHPKSKKAIIDVETRWGSSCDMLNRLLELKEVCKDVSDTFNELNVTDDQWRKTEIIVCTYILYYLIFNLIFKMLQLVISKFY